jgi:putative hydrolase of the HAD superfamily
MKKGVKNKNSIKAIVFDVGGVLALGKNSTWDKEGLVPSGVHIDIAKKLKISLDQYMDAIDTNYALSIEGKISKEEVIKIFSKNLKISADKLKEIYILAYRKHFKQNKDLFKKAHELKKLGYRIAVLSDQWPLSRDALMPKTLYKIFNPLIVSCDVGMRKPHFEIYKLTLKKLKLKPSEILFIDNQIWNIKPAQKIGIKTILFKDNKQLFENKLWKGLFK